MYYSVVNYHDLGIIGRVLKFAGDIHQCKILPGNFWPHFEKQDGPHRCLTAIKGLHILRLFLINTENTIYLENFDFSEFWQPC